MNNLSETSPFTKLNEYGIPYIDYLGKIQSTYNFKFYMKLVIESKVFNWEISSKEIVNSQMRVIYSSLLELFIEDNIAETFADIFYDYIILTFSESNNNNNLIRDADNNSIFHYDAVHGKGRLVAYKIIEDYVNNRQRKELGIDTDTLNISILEDTNLHQITVSDIINKNC